VLIGALLYVGYRLVNEDEVPNRIVISQGEVDSLAAQWRARRGRPPSPSEIDALVTQSIRTKVLAREARAFGLDQNDAVVERRLAQKLEFLFSDLARVTEPTDVELQAFLDEHLEDFTEPARLSFRHLYFNRDERDAAAADASQVLATIQMTPQMNTDTLGDRSLLATRYDLVTIAYIERTFGKACAGSVIQDLAQRPASRVASQQNVGEQSHDSSPTSTGDGWRGPFESAFGLHLVLIDEYRPLQIPDLPSIRDDVASEWRRVKQMQANEAFYQTLLGTYTVVVGDEQ
jgi:hypothetical protein